VDESAPSRLARSSISSATRPRSTTTAVRSPRVTASPKASSSTSARCFRLRASTHHPMWADRRVSPLVANWIYPPMATWTPSVIGGHPVIAALGDASFITVEERYGAMATKTWNLSSSVGAPPW